MARSAGSGPSLCNCRDGVIRGELPLFFEEVAAEVLPATERPWGHGHPAPAAAATVEHSEDEGVTAALPRQPADLGLPRNRGGLSDSRLNMSSLGTEVPADVFAGL
jgi:hypothetical protein